MYRVNQPSPAKIIGQVMSSDTMKPDHPFLEPAANSQKLRYAV